MTSAFFWVNMRNPAVIGGSCETPDCDDPPIWLSTGQKFDPAKSTHVTYLLNFGHPNEPAWAFAIWNSLLLYGENNEVHKSWCQTTECLCPIPGRNCRCEAPPNTPIANIASSSWDDYFTWASMAKTVT